MSTVGGEDETQNPTSGPALASFIKDEIERAEADMKMFRDRGQALLTLSGGLVAAFAAILAFVLGKDLAFSDSVLAQFLGVVGLLGFVLSGVMVLAVFWPRSVQLPDASDLVKGAEDDWDAEGWDQQVAVVSARYLESLRTLNESLGYRLSWAVGFQVGGICLVALLAAVVILD